jgi:hypothetical protein
MRHVDDINCNGIDETSTQMMSSMLDLTKKSVVWSNCSVMELHAFLRLAIPFQKIEVAKLPSELCHCNF